MLLTCQSLVHTSPLLERKVDLNRTGGIHLLLKLNLLSNRFLMSRSSYVFGFLDSRIRSLNLDLLEYHLSLLIPFKTSLPFQDSLLYGG